MAASNSRRSSSSKKNSRNANRSRGKNTNAPRMTEKESAMLHEIGLIALFALMVLCFLCNFGIIGPAGDAISGFFFGLFGLTAYLAPIFIFLCFAFGMANQGTSGATRKIVAGVLLFLMAGAVCDLISAQAKSLDSYSMSAIYEMSRDARSGGGIFGGSISFALQHSLGTIGAVLVVLLLVVVGVILLTERSVLEGVKKGGDRVKEFSEVDRERRKEAAKRHREEQDEIRSRREEEKRLKAEEKENEKILRMEKKVSGVMLHTEISNPENEAHRDDVHEIVFNEAEENSQEESISVQESKHTVEPRIHLSSVHAIAPEVTDEEEEEGWEEPAPKSTDSFEEPAEENPLTRDMRVHKEGIEEFEEPKRPLQRAKVAQPAEPISRAPMPEMRQDHRIPKKYMFPPLSRLQKGTPQTGDSTKELKETALRLQQTLNTFGVKVTITDISQGPSVTRYEMQPEQGVKVSKIVGLADDIKLNLAATDIRIEAPIPGKAAVGIEVPNKENMTVALRDLLESKEFKEFPSNIAFAVGKDIAGKTVVADIAKMPHMLIAGSTGSGKSVCINTIIMSILYKAHPDDVKLIMVDPKVVELSVYNGIPHLLIPVVTDPKKASAALHWGVSEMEDRYRKFADFNVRDLKGYNKKVESMQENGEEDAPAKMPQIVIIVDELADLMMVSPGEVEESICRLAQLARAAGIHLIIATQRPSVDVITGLIKANMPSRVAFAVSSGVDSRTILDMNGAEKLLGKGDMLFYPQGYSKPARIQGAFVSDKEVSDVVDFLKNQMIGNTYAEDIEEKIKNIGSGAGGSSSDGEGSELDELFERAGRFIIEKDKASIGMLQRMFKIGFNRAARIMDQLCEYGVVGEEEGTKPRKILMGREQFEQLVEEML